jgi:hypothetical protein
MKLNLARSAAAALALMAGGCFDDGDGESKSFACEANASSDFYANPTIDRSAYPGAVPTGLASPGFCSFATLTDALDAATGHPSARVVAAGGSAGNPARFTDEAFPLSLPGGVTVTTQDDPALGGAGLAPGNYIVQFAGATSTSSAAVLCQAGSVALKGMTLNGRSAAGARLEKGLHVAGTCSGEFKSLEIRDFGGTGITLESGATASLLGNDVHSNLANGAFLHGQLSAFASNRLHDNSFNQLVFSGPRAWSIDSGSGVCDASVNAVYCYTAKGVFGIFAQDGAQVTVQHTSFEGGGTGLKDYSAQSGSTISVSSNCSAITTCP